MEDGTVWCFGYNDNYECGIEGLTVVSIPTQVQGLSSVQEVAAGRGFTCALTTGGEVWCWGANTFGQLGNGTVGGYVATPARVMGIPTVRSMSVGGSFVLVVTAAGDAVWGWGASSSGELGRGATALESTGTPQRILGSASAQYEVAAGSTHSCLVERRAGNEELRCAGSNDYFELGLPRTGNVTTFEPTEALP
jgi:alpha-tubulin suppressor-like RCC1 family protein